MTPQDERIKQLEAKLASVERDRDSFKIEREGQRRFMAQKELLEEFLEWAMQSVSAIPGEPSKKSESLKAQLTEAQRVIKDFREALEYSECYCEESLPVNDFLKSSTCHYCEVLNKHPAPSEEKAE